MEEPAKLRRAEKSAIHLYTEEPLFTHHYLVAVDCTRGSIIIEKTMKKQRQISQRSIVKNSIGRILGRISRTHTGEHQRKIAPVDVMYFQGWFYP
jgi:hypothetical protein